MRTKGEPGDEVCENLEQSRSQTEQSRSQTGELDLQSLNPIKMSVDTVG